MKRYISRESVNGKPCALRGASTVWRGDCTNQYSETIQGGVFLPYHWTGHISRLARQLTYAEEELVAEIGSMFLSAATGIPQTEENFGNDVAYVRSWLSRVKTKDKGNAIFKAAAAANKAVNFLLEKAGMITTKTTETEQM